MRIQFGIGAAFFNPIAGNVPTASEPTQIVTLQDVDIEIDATIKDLRGQFQFPDDTAASDKKITWKSGFGRMDIDTYNNIFFGEAAIATGGAPMSVNEAHSVPAMSAYTITVTNSATFVKNLGVTYAATGQRLTPVASGPTQGQYSVSAGVYTFAAADASAAVLISYTYTVTTGRILTVNQHPQGWGPSLELFLSLSYQELTAGVPNYCHLYSCRVQKLGLPLKRADYLICSMEGEAYANAAGQVADFYES